MISLVDIHKTYAKGHAAVHALRGVTLDIDQGEFVAIMGPSGSGKSTLMHLLGLLDVPETGSYRMNGREVREMDEHERSVFRARTIGFVFQQFHLLSRVSALENVAMPLIYAPGNQGVRPLALLERVGLADRVHHTPNELSGGQQQRVAIARALVNAPSVILADEPTGNLDSQSSAEILRILKELNESGMTVIVVTHDPDVAAIAHRTLVMRDGAVLTDERRAPSTTGTAHAAADRVRSESPVESRRIVWQRMRELTALLRQAGRSLWANKTRTALSMLGVLIGVASVIAMMALGSGTKEDLQERIASMGANLLVLTPPRHQSRGVSLGAGTVSRLTLDDAEAIRQAVAGARNVSAGVRGTVQATRENKNWRTTLRGVEPPYEEIHLMTPQVGRFFTQEELLQRARVAVIGITVSKELFPGLNPVGQRMRINRESFEVVGLLPDKGASSFMDENDQILIPVTTAMRRVLGETYVRDIEVQAASSEWVASVEEGVQALMRERHRVPDDVEEAFSIRNMADLQSMLTTISSTLSILLLSIGIIALIVGGVGIMNIMLVSVTERTREIGLRKAVGAGRSDILLQFLVEAVVVSACGGILGLLLGMGAALAMRRLAGWAVAVSPLTLFIAFSFSVIVGIVFGLWPARKASQLEPIEALRYE